MTRKNNMNDKLLPIMGEIATNLRVLVGGKDINGLNYKDGCSIIHAREVLIKLRILLDKYDDLILNLPKKKNKNE